MSKIKEVQSILDQKTIALAKAIQLIQDIVECNAHTCDATYHWKGCPKIVKDDLEAFKAARDLE